MNQKEPEWVENVRKKVNRFRISKEIFYYPEVTSTNKKARELILQDTTSGTVIISSIQTAGRGRLGREWVSPPGGIYVSIVVFFPPHLTDLPLLTVAAAVGVARTIEKVLDVNPEIKWPNDIFLNKKKVCGILCELISGPRGWATITGIGINLNVEEDDLPSIEGYEPASIKSIIGKSISEENFLENFFKNLNEAYSSFLRGPKGTEKLLDQWRQYAKMLGQKVKVQFGEELLEGIAKDVDEKGYLVVLRPNGEETHVMAGHVILPDWYKQID